MKILLTILMLLPTISQAAYFRFDPLNEISVLASFKIGTPVDNVRWGSQTAVIKHHAEDGYFLWPGVSWSLLDAGFTKSASDGIGQGKTDFVFGPSIDLSEPIKGLLLWGVNSASSEGLEFLKTILRPTLPGQRQLGLSVGPSIDVDPGDFRHISQIKGAFVGHAGLTYKFK